MNSGDKKWPSLRWACRAWPLIFMTACAPIGQGDYLPVGPPTIVVRMTEFRFSYGKPLAYGRTVFRAVNDGKRDHRLTFLPLPEDVGPIDAHLRGPNRISVEPYAGVTTRKPGQSGVFAVDLEAGKRYAMVCLILDSDGQVHALKGMNSEFRVSVVKPGPKA